MSITSVIFDIAARCPEHKTAQDLKVCIKNAFAEPFTEPEAKPVRTPCQRWLTTMCEVADLCYAERGGEKKENKEKLTGEEARTYLRAAWVYLCTRMPVNSYERMTVKPLDEGKFKTPWLRLIVVMKLPGEDGLYTPSPATHLQDKTHEYVSSVHFHDEPVMLWVGVEAFKAWKANVPLAKRFQSAFVVDKRGSMPLAFRLAVYMLL